MNSDLIVKTFAQSASENSSHEKSDVTPNETSHLTKGKNPNRISELDTEKIHGPIIISYGDLVGMMDDIANAYDLSYLEHRLLGRILHTMPRPGYRTYVYQVLTHKIDFYAEKLGLPKSRISEGFTRLTERGIIAPEQHGRNKSRALADEFVTRIVQGMPKKKKRPRKATTITDSVNCHVEGPKVAETSEVIPSSVDSFENSYGFSEPSFTDSVKCQLRIYGSDSYGFCIPSSKIEDSPILSPSFQSRSLSLPGQPVDNPAPSNDAASLAMLLEGGLPESERFLQQQLKNGVAIETIREFVDYQRGHSPLPALKLAVRLGQFMQTQAV